MTILLKVRTEASLFSSAQGLALLKNDEDLKLLRARLDFQQFLEQVLSK